MTWESAYHAPVLAREVAELLGNAQHVLDGTLGGGAGHSQLHRPDTALRDLEEAGS